MRSPLRADYKHSGMKFPNAVRRSSTAKAWFAKSNARLCRLLRARLEQTRKPVRHVKLHRARPVNNSALPKLITLGYGDIRLRLMSPDTGIL